MKKKKNIELFIFLIMVYVTCLLVANITAFKLINILSFTVTAGTLVFPMTYILGDVFSEVFGFKITKKIIIGGFICNAIMILVFYIAIILPYPNYFLNQDAFKLVLSSTPRLFVAGLIAYLIGGLTNSYVLNYIKEKSKIKFLWFRTITSTIVGETLDSIIFLSIGFVGIIEINNLIFMIICQIIIKVIFEVIMTPFTYFAIKKVKTNINLEI